MPLRIIRIISSPEKSTNIIWPMKKNVIGAIGGVVVSAITLSVSAWIIVTFTDAKLLATGNLPAVRDVSPENPLWLVELIAWRLDFIVSPLIVATTSIFVAFVAHRMSAWLVAIIALIPFFLFFLFSHLFSLRSLLLLLSYVFISVLCVKLVTIFWYRNDLTKVTDELGQQ